MNNLADFPSVLAKGSVAEVKAILRATIGRIEVFPKEKKARVGFLRLPSRALLSRIALEKSARISVLAGARFVAIHNILSAYIIKRWKLPRKGGRT